MPVAASSSGLAVPQNNVVWAKGNIDVLCVCKQLHDECAELIYGTNTFLLFVAYTGVSFRFRWLLPSGVAPSATYPFIELLSERYLRLVKKIFVSVDLVDSYTGMIKYNVSGPGLTHGVRKQVQRLVNALRSDRIEGQEEQHRQLSRVSIRAHNGDNYLEAKKSDIVRQRDGSVKTNSDVAQVLEPFGDLYGVGSVSITGAVSEDYSQTLANLMMDKDRKNTVRRFKAPESDAATAGSNGVQLCVYGNDL